MRNTYSAANICGVEIMEEPRLPLKYFPFAVDLKGQKVLVVGGGKVAERKVLSLLQAEACVQVVSPQITEGLMDLVVKFKIKWKQKEVDRNDIKNIRLTIAATDNKIINEKVSMWAKNENIWVNVVDKPALSDFISPAVFFAGEGIVAVYSDGKDPVLSRDLKNFIKEKWNEFLSYRDGSQDSIL